MASRTTILLDPASEQAADELSRRWRCSRSEVIRRALVQAEEADQGLSRARRERRVEAFTRLCELMDDVDADAEIARVRAERQEMG